MYNKIPAEQSSEAEYSENQKHKEEIEKESEHSGSHWKILPAKVNRIVDKMRKYEECINDL